MSDTPKSSKPKSALTPPSSLPDPFPPLDPQPQDTSPNDTPLDYGADGAPPDDWIDDALLDGALAETERDDIPGNNTLEDTLPERVSTHPSSPTASPQMPESSQAPSGRRRGKRQVSATKKNQISGDESKCIILCGPPGTGKTYNAIKLAVELCEEPVPEQKRELQKAFNALVDDSRIVFVTFHQSMSYEDFVEGRQPVTGSKKSDDNSNTGFRLEVVPGILRRFTDSILDALSGPSPEERIYVRGKKIFRISFRSLKNDFDSIIKTGEVYLDVLPDIDFEEDSDYSYEDIRDIVEDAAGSSRTKDIHAKAIHQFRNVVRKGDIIILSKGGKRFYAIGEFSHYGVYFEQGIGHSRSVKWHWHDKEGRNSSAIYKNDFGRGKFHRLSDDSIKNYSIEMLINMPQDGNYVLVIDEINRGNISRVFGEVITLLDSDKRIGMPSELRISLPYSSSCSSEQTEEQYSSQFGLPKNLYIIGTMNTADRSIALIDFAIRRRFKFVEVLPDPGAVPEVEGVPLSSLLSTINDRIEYLYDREHQIGHGYFMECKTKEDVDSVMRGKVIPLLAEYFFGDWSKVAAVLGDLELGNEETRGGFLIRELLEVPPGLGSTDVGLRFRWRVRSEKDGFNYEKFV